MPVILFTENTRNMSIRLPVSQSLKVKKYSSRIKRFTQEDIDEAVSVFIR